MAIAGDDLKANPVWLLKSKVIEMEAIAGGFDEGNLANLFLL